MAVDVIDNAINRRFFSLSKCANYRSKLIRVPPVFADILWIGSVVQPVIGRGIKYQI